VTWHHFRWFTWPRLSYIIFEGCEHCGSLWRVRDEDSRTMYPFTGVPGTPDDPNRDQRYCRPCAKEHHEWWDGCWADYYHSLGR
jgi:hypothetical protein